jgi:hypothetical protein
VLDPEAISRAAGLPFLIVDVHFTNEGWWRTAWSNTKTTAENVAAGFWPSNVAKQLMSEVLVFARHAARVDCLAACLVLGMAPGVVGIVRQLTPEHLATVSESRGDSLRLRWQDDFEFWVHLLNAAHHRDRQALSVARMHAQLLFAGGLMSSSSPTA